MDSYPLLFTIRELISGNGFLAGVVGQGRCLMVNEGPEEGWWLYGVQPGGLAASGQNAQEAHLKFIVALRNLFADLASQSPDFNSFSGSARSFFCEIDTEDEARWKAGVAEVRAGSDVGVFAGLPRWSAEMPCDLQVLEINKQVDVTPQLNSSESFALPTAA